MLLQALLNTLFFACLLQHGGSFGSSEVVANHNAPILDCHAPTPNFDISGEYTFLVLLLSLPHTCTALSSVYAEGRTKLFDLVLIGLLYKAHPEGCQHTFANLAKAEAHPHEGASALVNKVLHEGNITDGQVTLVTPPSP